MCRERSQIKIFESRKNCLEKFPRKKELIRALSRREKHEQSIRGCSAALCAGEAESFPLIRCDAFVSGKPQGLERAFFLILERMQSVTVCFFISCCTVCCSVVLPTVSSLRHHHTSISHPLRPPPRAPLDSLVLFSYKVILH